MSSVLQIFLFLFSSLYSFMIVFDRIFLFPHKNILMLEGSKLLFFIFFHFFVKIYQIPFTLFLAIV